MTETDGLLEVHTDRLHLIYDKGPFTTHGLSVQAKGGYHSNDSVWRYGQNTPNLGGTARTLDDVDGAIPLEDGVLAFNGVALVDDSRTVLLERRTAGSPRAARAPSTSTSSPTAATTRAALKALYDADRAHSAAAALRAGQLVEPLPPLHRRRVRRR